MQKQRIEKGDFVDVHFTSSQSLFNAEVMYSPCASGDSWILRDEYGELHYVQLFERMDIQKVLTPT